MTDLDVWLAAQLKSTGMTEAELREAGGIDSGTLSNAKTRNSVGPDLAKKLAKGLGIPQAFVFYQLGLMDDAPELAQLDPIALNIVRQFYDRSEADKRVILATVIAVLERLEAGASGRSGTATREGAAGQNET